MHLKNKYNSPSAHLVRAESGAYDAPAELKAQLCWRYGVFFAHGTGFPARTYGSFLRALSPMRLRYVPCLGMEKDDVIAEDWKGLLEHLMDYMPQNAAPSVGVGHSLGAVLLLEAYYLRPKAFSHLVLMDPPIFSWSRRWPIRVARFFGQTERVIKQAQRAKRRQNFWKTKEEARTHLCLKSLFADFHPQSFEDYLKYGLQASERGYELCIPRSLEYNIFCSTPTEIHFMRSKLPTYVLYSAKYEVCRREDIRYIARQLPEARLIPVAGGHMFPLEQPEQTAELIQSLIL